MRILTVSNYYPEHPGGVETVAGNLVRGYRTRGHQVRWIASDVGPTPHAPNADDVPLKSWNVTEERLGFPYPLFGPAGFRRIVREIAACDAVHVHDCLYLTSAVATIAARRRHKPVLLTQHVGPVPYRRRLLRGLQLLAYATLGRFILRQAVRVIFVSPSVAPWFTSRAYVPSSPMVIVNGVDRAVFAMPDAAQRLALRSQLDLPAQSPVLLFSGRFVEKKGLHLLKAVAQQEPTWTWVMIGRPDDLDPRSWGFGNVRVLPPMSQSRLAAYYAAADLLVLPSVGEGFPVSVQEAMACGTPALISEEVGGTFPDAPAFVSARESVAIRGSIAKALVALRSDPGWHERVARYAREHWDWDAVIDRYLMELTALSSSLKPAVAQRVA